MSEAGDEPLDGAAGPDEGDERPEGGEEGGAEARGAGSGRYRRGGDGGGERPTQAMVSQRVAAVVALIAAGQSNAGVKRAVARMWEKEAQDREAALAKGQQPAAKVWGEHRPAERTIQRYIALANDEFAKAAERITEREMGKAILRMEDIMARCLAQKPPRLSTFVAAQRVINDILGIKRLVVVGDPDNPLQHEHQHRATLTDDQRAASFAQLQRKALARLLGAGVSLEALGLEALGPGDGRN